LKSIFYDSRTLPYNCVVLSVIMFMSWMTGNPFKSFFVVNDIEMFHCISTDPG